MALSLTIKRPLEGDLHDIPPSPPESPLYCSSPFNLLNSIAVSVAKPEIDRTKKRRKQEHPSFWKEKCGEVDDNEDQDDHPPEISTSESSVIPSSVFSSAGLPSSLMSGLPQKTFPTDIHKSSLFGSNGIKQELTAWNFHATPDSQSNGSDIKPHVVMTTEASKELLVSSLSLSPVTVSKYSPASDLLATKSHEQFNSQSDELRHNAEKEEEETANGHAASDDGEANEDGASCDGGSTEVCPECNKVFKRRVYLQRHMAREHWSTAKVFRCDKCSYETKHQSNLLVHRRTHTGERPYHCGACGQRYTQGHLLKAHIRSRHGANMQFYNLDKRSDGVRCRKALGEKLDANLMNRGSVGAGREDKIRFLLRAAEVSKQQSMPPPFGGLLPPSLGQYMNAFSSCLPSGMRPLLWPPVPVPQGLVGGPGFGLENLPNRLPSHAALLSSLAAPNLMLQKKDGLASSENLSIPNSIFTTLFSNSSLDGGTRLPSIDVKRPDLFNTNSLRTPLVIPNLGVSISQSSLPVGAATLDLGQPQDLSTNKRGLVEDSGKTDERQSGSPGLLNDVSRLSSSMTTSNQHISEKSISDRVTSPAMHIKDDELMEASLSKKHLNDFSRENSPANSGSVDTKCGSCDQESCPSFEKLKALRRNVYRMLSVFMPYLGISEINDCETDAIDEFLHEVIYSKSESGE